MNQQLDRLKAFWERYIKTREGHFKAGYQEFATPDQFEAQLEALLRGWLDERVLKGRAVVWPIATKGSPFRGLAAFGAKHAAVFFGRGADITRAVDAFKDAAERGTPFLLLIGSSGSGKSSLARAGLAQPDYARRGGGGRSLARRDDAARRAQGGAVLALAQSLFAGLKDIPPEEEGRRGAARARQSRTRRRRRLATALAAGDAASVGWALDRIAEGGRGEGRL